MCATKKPENETHLIVNGKAVFGDDTWYIQGEPYRILSFGARYLMTNGDPETKYVMMQKDGCGDPYIITHKMFIANAVPNPPRKDVYITPGQILASGPCSEGVWMLGRILGAQAGYRGDYGALVYRVTKELYRMQLLDKQFTVNYLHEMYTRMEADTVPASWLLHIAKALKLVPKDSKGPDVQTLRRLLGIDQ